MNLIKSFSKISLISLLVISLNSCSKIDWDSKPIVSGKERARKNVQEGRGISVGGAFGRNKETNFLFASSNPLWRASLDTIDFMSISNVDYAGGLIISDWYSESDPKEAVKITIIFLTNEVRADALKIDIRKRDCNQNNQCIIKKVESDLDNQIKDKILKKAAIYKKDLDKKLKKRRPKKVYPDPASQ